MKKALSSKSLNKVLMDLNFNPRLRKSAAKDFMAFLNNRFKFSKTQKRVFDRISDADYKDISNRISKMTEGEMFLWDVEQTVKNMPPDKAFESMDLSIRLIIKCISTYLDGKLISKVCKVIGVEVIF